MSKLKKFATVGLAVVTAVSLSGIATPASAAALTQSQIDAIISLLQSFGAEAATIANVQTSLTGGTPAATGGSTTVTSGYNYTRNLTVGSKGADVKALQQFLNANGYTIAASGAGSPGNESEYFGSLTKAALAKFQAANGISPAVGYFGPITIAKLSSMGGTTTGGTTTGGTTVTPGVVPAGTDLLVELASDTPGAKIIGTGTAFNPAMKIKLSAGAKDVSISSITLQKGGFVANTNTNGVDILTSNGVRHGQVVTSINADNTIMITMTTDPIVVKAGTAEYVTVRFNLNSGNYTGTIAFSIASVSAITADTTAISGAFPLTGATMNIVNGGSSLASTTLDVLTSTGSSTLNVDVDSLQEITKFRVAEVASTEGIYLHSLTLYNYGNAGDKDYKDVTLEAQDGTVLATAQPSGQYVTFTLATPYLIDKGLTRDFTVKARIIDGASKTMNFVVYNNYDIDLRGATTNVSLIPGNGSSDTAFPVGNGYNTQSIGSGSITLTRATDSPSNAVAPGTTNTVLAKFLARPTGENYELRQVSFYIATSSTGIDLTGTVYVKVNGVIVYSTAASSISNTAATTYTLSSYPILTAGQDNTITIEGSINSSATAASSYTVTDFGFVQAKRLVTNDLVDPSATQSGLTVSVNSASVAITTLSTPVANSVVSGTNEYEFATIQLNAQSSGEDVKISKIIVTDTLGGGSDYSGVSNLVMYKDNETSPLSVTGSTATNAATVTFNFSNPIVVTKTTPVTLHLKANAVSTTGTSHKFNIASSTSAVTAVGVTTGNTLTNGSDVTFAGNGQAQTIVSAGSLTLSLVSGSGASPSADQTLSVGTTDGTYFAFKMTSQYETQKITSLKLTATSATRLGLATSSLKNIRLYEGTATTPFASAPQFDACTSDASSTWCYVTFTASDNMLSAPVPTTGVTIYVKADVGAAGSSVLSDSFKFFIASSTGDVAVKGSVTASTSGTRTGTPTAGGMTYLVPQNVVIEAVSPTAPATIGTGSGQKVASFKVTNNGSAAIRLSTSTVFKFTDGGSSTSTYKLYASTQNGSSGDTSVTLTSSATSTQGGYVYFDISAAAAADRTIDGGGFRYITIKNQEVATGGSTYQFSVSSLGHLLYQVSEADLGYSGNGDTDLSDVIQGLYITGKPALETVTVSSSL